MSGIHHVDVNPQRTSGFLNLDKMPPNMNIMSSNKIFKGSYARFE
jgi:hypothetical protein